MLRIIAGDRRGHKLFSLKGQHLRPTADRVREALFNVLQDSIKGKHVLELFAGTGAVGLEALSRGASLATFVERDKRVCRLIDRNIAHLGYKDRTEVWHLNVFRFLSKIELEDRQFDIVFIDPPYDFFRSPGHRQRIVGLLRDLGDAPWLDDEGMVVLQHSQQFSSPDGLGRLELVKEKRYGRSVLAYYRRVLVEEAQLG